VDKTDKRKLINLEKVFHPGQPRTVNREDHMQDIEEGLVRNIHVGIDYFVTVSIKDDVVTVSSEFGKLSRPRDHRPLEDQTEEIWHDIFFQYVDNIHTHAAGLRSK
jgi:hypothetical protein